MRGFERRPLMRRAAGLLVAAGCGLAVVTGLRAGGLLGPGLQAAAAAGRAHDAGGKSSRTAGAPGAAAPELPTEASTKRTAEPDAGGPGGAHASGRAGEGAREGAGLGGDAPSAAGDRDREARGGSSGVIVLDGFTSSPGAVSVEPRGFDPGGPRALVLWRVEDGGAVRVAEGFSDSSGELHFPQVAEPGDPLALVVAPEGAPPPSHDTSDPALLAGRTPLPPVVEEVRPDASGVILRLGARESTGAVLVASGDGTLVGRFALPAPSGPAARTLQIAVDGPVGRSGLLVAQELPDGRRSSFEPVPLPAAAAGAKGAEATP